MGEIQRCVGQILCKWIESSGTGHLGCDWNRHHLFYSLQCFPTLAAIIRHVVSSTSEAECAALFYNCKNAMPLQQTVKETGPHDPNTIVTIITLWHMASLLIQWLTKCQKTMDMWLDWIRCCQAQQQFNFQLKRDQQTSPIKHHEKIWSTYVLDLTTPSSSHPCVLQLQGCIRIICQDTYNDSQ